MDRLEREHDAEILEQALSSNHVQTIKYSIENSCRNKSAIPNAKAITEKLVDLRKEQEDTTILIGELPTAAPALLATPAVIDISPVPAIKIQKLDISPAPFFNSDPQNRYSVDALTPERRQVILRSLIEYRMQYIDDQLATAEQNFDIDCSVSRLGLVIKAALKGPSLAGFTPGECGTAILAMLRYHHRNNSDGIISMGLLELMDESGAWTEDLLKSVMDDFAIDVWNQVTRHFALIIKRMPDHEISILCHIIAQTLVTKGFYLLEEKMQEFLIQLLQRLAITIPAEPAITKYSAKKQVADDFLDCKSVFLESKLTVLN